MKKNSINAMADALQVSAFCKHWWKKLVKECDSCHQGKEQKIMIYTRIARGLIIESLKLSDNKDDIHHIKLELDNMFGMWQEEGKLYE